VDPTRTRWTIPTGARAGGTIPLGRVGVPDVAGVIEFLLSDASASDRHDDVRGRRLDPAVRARLLWIDCPVRDVRRKEVRVPSGPR
jgi:hypothetical protein